MNFRISSEIGSALLHSSQTPVIPASQAIQDLWVNPCSVVRDVQAKFRWLNGYLYPDLRSLAMAECVRTPSFAKA